MQLSIRVAPLAGAWVEIDRLCPVMHRSFVAPLAGAWVEIGPEKYGGSTIAVAPLAGAWVEIIWSHSGFRS